MLAQQGYQRLQCSPKRHHAGRIPLGEPGHEAVQEGIERAWRPHGGTLSPRGALLDRPGNDPARYLDIGRTPRPRPHAADRAAGPAGPASARTAGAAPRKPAPSPTRHPRPGHLEVLRRLGRVTQQRCLPDARLAPYHQDPAAPRPNIREQPVQGNELLPAAPKHHGPAAWTRRRTGRNFITASMCIHVIGAGPASDRCALGPGGLPMAEPIRLRRERSHPRDPRPTPWLNSRTPQSRAEVPSLSDSPGTGRTRRACPRPVHPRARARTPGCRLGIPQTRTRSFQAEDSRTNWKGRPR